MVGMCRIIGHRSQLIMLILLLAQNLMNIMLAHFQDRYNFPHISSWCCNVNNSSTDAISLSSSYDTPLDAKEDLHSLCGELIPVLERLELVNEVCRVI